MAKGKMLHTKIAEEIVKSQPVAVSMEMARRKLDRKEHAKKPWLDSLREHIGRMLDNTNIRDWIYATAFVSGVYMAYQMITLTEMNFIEFVVLLLGGKTALKLFGESLKIPDIINPQLGEIGLNQTALATSIIATYLVLKLDVSDMTSAIGKIGTVIGGLRL